MIKYPLSGGYKNNRKCIWNIRTKSSGQNIKIKFADVDLEYDQFCGAYIYKFYLDFYEILMMFLLYFKAFSFNTFCKNI